MTEQDIIDALKRESCELSDIDFVVANIESGLYQQMFRGTNNMIVYYNGTAPIHWEGFYFRSKGFYALKSLYDYNKKQLPANLFLIYQQEQKLDRASYGIYINYILTCPEQKVVNLSYSSKVKATKFNNYQIAVYQMNDIDKVIARYCDTQGTAQIDIATAGLFTDLSGWITTNATMVNIGLQRSIDQREICRIDITGWDLQNCQIININGNAVNLHITGGWGVLNCTSIRIENVLLEEDTQSAIIDALKDVTADSNTHSITLRNTSLTAENRLAAVAKGWQVL